MWHAKARVLAYIGTLIAGIVSMVVGFVWFFTPGVYVLETSGFLGEYPNWRGLPFMILAVVLWISRATLTWHERLRTSQVAVSLGLLFGGYFSVVAGLVWLFTPEVIAAGDFVLLEYPNSAGLPFIALGGVLWVAGSLLVRRQLKGKSHVAAAVGLLVAGLVGLLVGLIAFPIVNVMTGSTGLLHPYQMVPAVAVWIIAALFLSPELRWNGLSNPTE